MGSKISTFLLLHCWVFLVLSSTVHSDTSEVTTLKFLKTPHKISNRNYANFDFRVLEGGTGRICTDCATNCKLDNGKSSACEGGKISYTRLVDGNHSFEVCTNGPRGVACASYNWTVDTLNPTAHITAAMPFTNASRVSVNISFSEPCGGGGAFRCSSINACNLLVYGPGKIIPSTLNVVEPNLKYSIVVSVSERVRYGRLILVMDKNFCTDSAGNQFTRTENSSLFIHFDRRSVFVNLRTHISERLLQINSDTRTVLATNKSKNLKVYLYFTEPVMNSSAEIMNSLNTSEGSLVPISGNNSLGQRRFGYQLINISELAIVTMSLHSDLVISRQGTPVAPVSPVTFLYDSQRPTVRLSTTCNMRTKEKSILILVKFLKPVFGFNSSHISISGGDLKSFHEISWRSYAVHVQANSDVISVNVPENITTDVSGNRNRASNTLQVRHYSVPVESLVISLFATAAFAVTALIAGFLTVSTTSLISSGAFSRPSAILCSHPARNLFRIASHIQVFAFSRWLPVTLPVEYYELARGLQWSIPYFNLPWEREKNHAFMVGSSSSKDRLLRLSETHDSMFFEGLQPEAANVDSTGKAFGLPLTPMEYRSYFESQNIVPEAEYISDPQNSHGWRDFSRSMFWLAVIGGSLILLHALLLMILKLRRQKKEKQSYGALIFPRFEIFLLILALPCFCEASAALLKGGTSTGTIVGVLILSLVAFMLLFLLLFLSFGITLGNLLQYKEVHQEGQKFHWYQEIIRVTLGPGKRGQWTWKNQSSSIYLTIFGPLFEDLRGPPQYMLSQIAGSSLNKPGDRIIASDDETEDAEAPFIQKLFGILRIYYTLIECVKRVILGVVCGAYSGKWSSRSPLIVLLCITSFQLFFMVLKKPFIKKKVQLVEIISVSCEVAVFAFCIVLLEREFSDEDERKVGISMVTVFLLAFLVQMINEWYAIFRQIKRLDPVKNLFLHGLKMAFLGFLLFFYPHNLIKNRASKFPLDNNGENGYSTSADRNRGSGSGSGSGSSGDKPWLRRIRELARSSFSKEEANKASSSDPSTSYKPRWSDFLKSKRSGSSSASTSTDFKSKPRGQLYKELEDIFASK
ncbi:hypothetical protein BUALT_Bualt07G0027200 [Buddleja alternifolia]|uniref:Bacterial Ig-like domain-containing protein n=1 Tax=Buddleja alternifolia TaxID=168488 RepID=A0AAV6X7N8_9LAMI|nr:hypothetical protein BUALT_Bualt07G0027200 [Buddleja alternifolia]